MKVTTAFTFGIVLLLFFCFRFSMAGDTSVGAYSSLVWHNTPAGPPIEVPSPSPTCSPQPTPVSEKAKNNPVLELDGESVLNAALGTPDWDCDGVCNIKDNCDFVYNPDQKDSNGNGVGDVCEPGLVDASFKDSRCDQDRDGIPDFRDNCFMVCNPDQRDANKNGLGDACDPAFRDAVFELRVCKNPRKLKVLKPQGPSRP